MTNLPTMPVADETVVDAPAKRPRGQSRFAVGAGRLRFMSIVAVLIGIGGAFTLLSPDFLEPRNLTNLAFQTVPVGLMALGFVFVLLLGEIDLSLAALSAVAAAVGVTLLVNHGWPLAAGIGIAVVVGAAVAAVQVGIIILFGPPSFLVTLGGSFVLSGLLWVILPLKAAYVSIYGTTLNSLGSGFIAEPVAWILLCGGVTVFVLLRVASLRGMRKRGLHANMTLTVILPASGIAAVGALAVWYLGRYRGIPTLWGVFMALLAASAYATTQTRFGWHLLAVGGNREAARRAGVRVELVVAGAFIIAGGLAALSGLASAIQQGSVNSVSGTGTALLDAIAAAVIGGASLFGGRGSVWGALTGALVLATIGNGMDLLGVSTFYREITTGCVVVVAVVVDASLARGRIRVGRG